MPYVEMKDGSKMYYHEKGKGVPIVFVHGWWITSWEFDEQIDYLGKWYRAMAFDLPGHGKSEKPTTYSYKLEALTESLDYAISKLVGNEKVVLVGQNMGGMISLMYATNPVFAKRLKGLVLVGATPKYRDTGSEVFLKGMEKGEYKINDRSLQEAIATATDFHSRFVKVHKDFVKEFAGQVAMTDAEVGLKTYHSMVHDYDVSGKLGNINVPTLILTGDKDVLVQPQNSNLLHEKIRNSELVTLSPDIGHHIQFEARDQFHKVLLDFLRKLS
jgi:3-oxoadipate enol-lactonase